jgi:nitrile hydratase accessory protein
MTKDRRARPDIAEMHAQSALPRKSGEMVFHNDWERRAFAIAVSLAEQGVFDWAEFQQKLIRAIAEAEQDDPNIPSRGYYESWLVAMEALLEEKKLLGDSVQ